MSAPGKVRFHFVLPPFRFPARTRLKQFVQKLALEEGHAIDSIDVVFCSDEYLLRINQEFLQHDTLTDIITFPFSSPGEPLKSEIYISVERVRENAQIYAKPFLEELYRVLFHGLLHLCGYRDKSDPEQKQMRRMEAHYLEQYRSTWNF